ncbi:hypothetical protein [Microbacterium azadirachtae]|uniref:YqeB PH domain-containing protein n=1 Tax=Microbacterium azadirachtae TaxID=582680 RepID=A0A0F0LEA3_9MICO|nr:hypothetical protein [Microbacterium azadirachtae]KJL31463.1 hypothetical protein RS86_03586 [Microbacterium azadirachtae]
MSATTPTDETELRMTLDTKIVIWVVCAALGVSLGLALPWLLQNIASWPIPFIDQLKFLGSFDAPIMVIGRPAILGIIGIVIAFVITYQSARLRISDTQITITEGDDSRLISRDQVGGVFRHGGKVRIESPEGRVLFDDDVEGGKHRITAAFQKHGYPWEGA